MPPPDQRRRRSSSSLDGPTIVVAVIATALLGMIGWWYWTNQQAPQAQPPSEFVAPPGAPAALGAPLVAEEPPAPAIDTEAGALPALPLPALDSSDGAFLDEASQALDTDLLGRWLVSSNLIPRLVATVDNLPGSKLSLRTRATPKVEGPFLVVRDDRGLRRDPGNAVRYQPMVEVLARADLDLVTALYRRYYPLFQQAYRDLGYDEGSFNQRLVAVIDHLLATPEVAGDVALVQPKVFYEFADPKLEALSAGQKAMIRLGPEQSATVKVRLREFRSAIAGASAPAG